MRDVLVFENFPSSNQAAIKIQLGFSLTSLKLNDGIRRYAGLAALEQRRAAERQAQLRHAPREVSSGFARTRNNPDEGTGGLVVIRDEGVDVLDEFGTAPEGLTIERLFGKDREPDFDLV